MLENATIVGKVDIKTTFFDPRDRRSRKGRSNKPKTDTTLLRKGVYKVNRICSKYDAYTEISSGFHVVDRFKRGKGMGDREYGIDDITHIFSGLEKNTTFFNDLEMRSNVKREENRKAHLIDRKRKTHMIVKMLKSPDPKFKYFIPIVSIMGKFDMKYINQRKNKVYYAY